MRIILGVILILSSNLLFASGEKCYETLTKVKEYAILTIETDSQTYADVTKFYCDKAQLDCVVYAESMDATRHLNDTIKRIK